MSYSPLDLAYHYGALEPIESARALEPHHGKHAAYVARLDATQEPLAEAREREEPLAWEPDRAAARGGATVPSPREAAIRRC